MENKLSENKNKDFDKDEEKAHEYHSKAEALDAKLQTEARAWAEKMLKNIKREHSSSDEAPW